MKSQYDQAIKDYNKAIRLDPHFKYAYYGRGKVYQDMGQKEKAIQDFEKALGLDPNIENVKQNLQELRGN
jgi:tetratricopeptide (TPR) repeat protein